MRLLKINGEKRLNTAELFPVLQFQTFAFYHCGNTSIALDCFSTSQCKTVRVKSTDTRRKPVKLLIKVTISITHNKMFIFAGGKKNSSVQRRRNFCDGCQDRFYPQIKNLREKPRDFSFVFNANTDPLFFYCFSIVSPFSLIDCQDFGQKPILASNKTVNQEILIAACLDVSSLIIIRDDS